MERQSEFARDELPLDNEQELRRALSALHLSRCEREILQYLSECQRAAGPIAELIVGRDELVKATGCHSSTVSAACSRLQARGLMRVYRRGRGANSFVVDWLAVFDREARPVQAGRRVEVRAQPGWRRRPDARQLRFEFVNDIACEVVGEWWGGVCIEVGCRVDGFVVAFGRDNEPRQQAPAAPENATSKRDIERQRTTSCRENATSSDAGATSSPPSPDVATTASIPSSIPTISSAPTDKESIPITHGEGGFQKFWEGDGLTTDQLKDPEQVQTLYERACEARAAEGLEGRRVEFFALAAMCVRPGVAKVPGALFVHRLKRRDGFGNPWWAAAADGDRREAKRMISWLDRGGAVGVQVDGCGTVPRPTAPPVDVGPATPSREASSSRQNEVVDDETERRRAAFTDRLRKRVAGVGS